MAALATLTGVRPRTIRHYLDHGVLARPEFRGTATRYQRTHLLHLLAIQRLRREGVPTLSAIKQRIDAAGEAELLEAVRVQSPSAAVAAALGLPAPEANGQGLEPPAPARRARVRSSLERLAGGWC